VSGLQAVLFDMDGTLCDTEPAWMAAESALARRYGAEWTRADGLRLVGNDLTTSGAYIKQRMRVPLTADEVVEQLIDEVLHTVERDGVGWLPGAIGLVEECNQRGLPTALVTMSYRRLATAVVDTMPAGRFDTVVTGDEVRRGKPAPDCYLAAAERLGAEPASTIAIEDSPTGAASAEAAGCLVLVVPNQVDVPIVRQRRVVPSLEQMDVDGLHLLMSQR
jgi:HAD superfamily hydrolase (TIGR01509 family)